ncbi:MAG: T9SS type A sorting domain-containing protein, partial [Saprospiraceae bacterium]|nr:T9SS type A sorting domain-containing protein [Bacteroidia bacterium]NNL90603.1 T9SS type A sorting domain-containing protein [Saprospiraceae bacterium]
VGTLACNNSVNVSINNNCILELLPEMILEGEEENNDAYSLVIVDATTGEELIGNMVDEDQIGNEFIVTVIEECGGNSCWGRLTVEDKSIPSIVPFCAQVPIVSTCFDFDSDPSMPAGFPDFGMSSSSIYDADFNNWLVSGFDACNDVILSYEDEVITTDVCADPHVLNRTWTAVDINNGAETSCQVTINVSLLDGSMIQWPNSYDSGLDSDLPGEADTDGYYPSLDACNQNNETVLLTGDKWLEDEFGNPSPLSTGSPQSEAFSCPNLQVIGYKDQVLPVCGSSRKILRQWTVWDACELTDIMHTQIITLMDVAPPICIAPIETQVYTDVHTCGADVEITPPFVTGECDDYTYTIKYKFSNAGIYDPATFTDAGVIYDTDLEKYVITDVDFDTDSIWIQYIVRDACGNVTDDCFTELELLDREQPIPACDLNNVISLNSYGYAFAGPATFDDNSWDNCGIYQTVVQKMDDECECHEAKFDFLHSLGSYNGHTYYLSKEKMNGFKAFGLAEALDGYVAVINDEEENEWLRERVDIYTDESFFIGLSGESIAGLEWMNDDDFDYSNWDVAEPSLQSVVGAKGDYHVVMNEDGSWDVERRNRLDTYYVLELDNSCTWSQKISFCCEDVGQETMVALRVIDWHGNHNLCMVNVRVLEFEDPIITCPSDVNMDCQEDFDADDLSRFGEATATDNCNLKEITETSSGFQSFNCGQGSITRTFTAIDFANNTASCTQRITLAPINQFEFSDIVWPREVTLSDEVCTLEDIDPSRTGVPTWDEENFPCSNITYTHSDLLFLIVDGVCQKLVRTWTVVDWCQNNMIWEETQVIKMINTIPPEINFETCRPQTFSDATPISQCLVQIDGIGAGTNEVAGTCPIDPKWTYTIDYHSDGTIDDSGIGNDASGAYPYGTHEINWTVMDGCGNTDSCVKVITVIDNLPPTPYCHGQIVIPISDPEGVEIWASDLDLGSFDNCPTNPVYFSFAENILVANRLLTCDDLDSSSNIGNLVVDLWVYDNINPSLANKSNCIVSIILQDNSDVCGSGTSNSVSAISGSVRTESLEMIDEVEISIASASMSDNMMSSTGEFAFDNLAMYKDYNVNAFKDDNYLSGVSTLDLVLIQRHILGLQKLDSPYKVIAADINDSETITAIDLIELRKLVLGIYEDLPNNYSWRFVESSFNFVDPQHPFPYNESVNVDNLEKLVNDADFVGVKIGDVNNSVSENLISNDIDARSRDHILNVDVITTITDKGNQRLQFVAKADDQYLGAQFAFSFDAFDSELLAMIPMQMNIANEHVAWDKVDDGQFVVSWNAFESQEINKDDVLFELLFKGNKASVNVDQAVTNFESEIYTLEDKGVQINSIKFNDHSSELFVFNVDQNSPNPFKDQTEIKFTIDKKGPVVLTVTDQTGRLLYREQNEYNAGINSITLKSESLNANGLLYYQIATGSHTVTKKMIVLQ